MQSKRGEGGASGEAGQEGGADDGGWEARPGVVSQRLPSLNIPRHFHGAALTTPSNHVFVVGGRGRDESPNSSVERLRDDSNSAWEVGAGFALPTARQLCGVCAVGTTVVVVGGHNGNYLDVVEAVDTVSGAHTTLPSLPQKVSGCGVVSVQGKVIVAGGRDGLSDVNTVWALDVDNNPNSQQPLQWTSLPSMTQGRCNFGVAAGGGCVFVCGGEGPLDSCEMLRVAVGGEEQGGWEALPPMPKKLAQVGCCYGGGNVFVAGGGYTDPQRSVFALSVRERKWTLVAELATGRAGCAAVCVGRRVMVLGGYNYARGGCLGGCEAFQF